MTIRRSQYAASKQTVHILHATRGHWTVMQMKEQIIYLAAQWKADLVIVEDTSSGMGLLQLLRNSHSSM